MLDAEVDTLDTDDTTQDISVFVFLSKWGCLSVRFKLWAESILVDLEIDEL